MTIDCYSNIFCLGQIPIPSATPTPTPTITQTLEPTPTPAPTETPFIFSADYILLTYEFIDGSDLDTRTRIVTPDIGQNSQPNYVGWGVLTAFPPGPQPYIIEWGRDNTGNGFESALINLTELKTQYPESTTIVIDLRSFWYGLVGIQPVVVSATLWKGGEPIKEHPFGFSFTNPTATSTFNISSAGKVISLQPSGNKSNSSGDRVVTLTYNFNTNQGFFDSNDTITPSV